MVHGCDEHGGDLAGDDVVGHAVGDLGVDGARYEVEEVMIHCVEVFAMLVAVVQTSASNLRKLACAVEALGCKWVDRVIVNAPVRAC